GQSFHTRTEGHEAVIVILGGRCNARTSNGNYDDMGRRENVFTGMPWALYVPRDTAVEISATTPQLEFAVATVPTDEDHPERLVRPRDVHIELRGGGTNSRQINQIIPPGFDCHRLVCVEVFTPSGNWSSYPPHKHDEHRTDEAGHLLEGDLEEIYFYKFARPNAWALQRIYTDDRTTDETVVAEDNDIVLVPHGYHPVSAGFGYDCYYLNFLAGSAQTLACTDDP